VKNSPPGCKTDQSVALWSQTDELVQLEGLVTSKCGVWENFEIDNSKRTNKTRFKIIKKLFSLQNFHLMIKKDGEKCKELVRVYDFIESYELYVKWI